MNSLVLSYLIVFQFGSYALPFSFFIYVKIFLKKFMAECKLGPTENLQSNVQGERRPTFRSQGYSQLTPPQTIKH